ICAPIKPAYQIISHKARKKHRAINANYNAYQRSERAQQTFAKPHKKSDDENDAYYNVDGIHNFEIFINIPIYKIPSSKYQIPNFEFFPARFSKPCRYL